MVQYIQSNHVEATQLGDEWIILHTEKFTVTKLNEIGGFCWGLLNQAQTVDSLIQTLTDQYLTAEEIAKDDIESYLLDLLQFGLIQHAI
ncbi:MULTISPECIES: PqqD family protein [Peribacillus]|uniref:PqqD family protein n=1 Tax=Peribacillus TaxID=2675229 RepID=UPI001F4E7F8B|nr:MULTISPECIES: PqqD family protein [unclassified Peribacillus]MCK1983027.1 PqqD family protein [Peribacillus sp. Aquil_B1]MCK2011091.1 PqqD family protein [Peribacillus sp. Aquil_B8]